MPPRQCRTCCPYYNLRNKYFILTACDLNEADGQVHMSLSDIKKGLILI